MSDPSPYASMSHAELYRLRASLPPDDPRQAEIAPYEHAAFAREWTEENPWVAVPSLAVAIPGYTAMKALGLTKARSPASVSEMKLGFQGIRNGLLALAQRPRNHWADMADRGAR